MKTLFEEQYPVKYMLVYMERCILITLIIHLLITLITYAKNVSYTVAL